MSGLPVLAAALIPSHVGIKGNEAADQTAKLAPSSDLLTTNFQMHSDLKATIKLKSLP